MSAFVNAAQQQATFESTIRAQNNAIKRLQRYVVNIHDTFQEQQSNQKDSLAASNIRIQKIEEEMKNLSHKFVSSSTIDSLTNDYLERTQNIKKSLNLYFSFLVSILIIGIIGAIIVIRKMLHGYTEGEQSPVGQMQVFVDNIKTAITNEKQDIHANQTDPLPPEPDHELPVRVAEEVFRMRTRLSRMAGETKGVSALLNAVNRLEDELNIKGYKIVNLTGTDYHDEMTILVKEFVPLEELSQGEKKILRMIKPQVKFMDKVISFGECEVAMSIEDLAQK